MTTEIELMSINVGRGGISLSVNRGGYVAVVHLDFAAYDDGGMPHPFAGDTWSISAGKAKNTPTEGSELLTDPGVEVWSDANTLTSWQKTQSGTSSVNQESSEIHGGSYAVRLDVDGPGSTVSIRQTVANSNHAWLALRLWAKSSDISAGPHADVLLNVAAAYPLTASYAQYHLVNRADAANKVAHFRRNINTASTSVYLDDLSIKAVDFATMFAFVDISILSSSLVARAAWTIPAGGHAGVVLCADSISAPQNCVLGVLDRFTNTAKLLKYVNGVPSEVLSAAASYVAGAHVEVRRTGQTTWQLWYNDVQVGSDQTISDNGIVGNGYHGMFSTGGDCVADSFFFRTGLLT